MNSDTLPRSIPDESGVWPVAAQRAEGAVDVRVLTLRSAGIIECRAFRTRLEALLHIERCTAEDCPGCFELTLFANGSPIFRRLRGVGGWKDDGAI